MISFILTLLFAACRPPLGGAGIASTTPEVVRYAPPRYTEAARRARIQGTVSVEVVVGSDGAVIDQRVVHELPMGLPNASLLVLPSWRFNRSAAKERRV